MKLSTNDKPSVRPEKVELVRKLLQELPEKDTRISKRETLARLEADIRKALKKGYTYKEIAQLLKANGVIISMQFIKEVIEPENKKENLEEEVIESINDTLNAEAKTEIVLKTEAEAKEILETETRENILPEVAQTRAEIVSEAFKKVEAETSKTNKSGDGQFVIRPDRPKGEL